MARISEWRRIGLALAALVLTAFTFGPGLDSIVCGSETGFTASAADLSVEVTTPSHDDAGHADDSGAACIHGHCHHGNTYAQVALVAAEEPASRAEAAHPLPQERVPTSDPKFGLMRPPRV